MNCCGSEKTGSRTRLVVFLMLGAIAVGLLVSHFGERLLATVPFLLLLVGPLAHEIFGRRVPKNASRAVKAVVPGETPRS